MFVGKNYKSDYLEGNIKLHIKNVRVDKIYSITTAAIIGTIIGGVTYVAIISTTANRSCGYVLRVGFNKKFSSVPVTIGNLNKSNKIILNHFPHNQFKNKLVIS